MNLCSANRGYRLAPSDFINLSHGIRAENIKSGKQNTEGGSAPLSWRSYSNSQNNSSRPNTSSAFASFNNVAGFPPAFVKGEMQYPVSPVKIMGKAKEQNTSDRRSAEQKTRKEPSHQPGLDRRPPVAEQETNSKVWALS